MDVAIYRNKWTPDGFKKLATTSRARHRRELTLLARGLADAYACLATTESFAPRDALRSPRLLPCSRAASGRNAER